MAGYYAYLAVETFEPENKAASGSLFHIIPDAARAATGSRSRS